jgi:hypothetical protein
MTSATLHPVTAETIRNLRLAQEGAKLRAAKLKGWERFRALANIKTYEADIARLSKV